jgi:type I restriction-modification system DNA methylase subunit
MVDMVKATQHVFHVLNDLRDNLYANCGISQGDIIAAILLYTLINAHSNCSKTEKKWVEELIHKKGVRHLYFDERENNFINKSIEALKVIDKDIFANIYADAIDWVIEEVFASQQYGQFSQPVDITMLVGELVRRYTISSIYNPFAGLGSYAEISDSIHYYGQEIDELVHLFGKIRLKALGYKVSDY